MEIIKDTKAYETTLEKTITYLNSILDENSTVYIENIASKHFLDQLLLELALEAKLVRDVENLITTIEDNRESVLNSDILNRNTLVDRNIRYGEKIAEFYNNRKRYTYPLELDELLKAIVYAEPHYIDKLLN